MSAAAASSGPGATVNQSSSAWAAASSPTVVGVPAGAGAVVDVLEGCVVRGDDVVLVVERVVLLVAASFEALVSLVGALSWEVHPARRRMAATAAVVMGCMQSYPP